jgi:antitoxin component YwqK of YwqJK toxin-antitoxin module
VKSLLSLLLLSVLSLPSVVLGVDFDELVYRDGLFYKKFTTVPFTGQTSGLKQDTFKNGNREGPSVWYYENGQLASKLTYKDGERDGHWVFYNKDGTKRMTPFKVGDVTLDEGSGLYRNGRKVLSR